jgi:hypothetical protein
MLPSAEWPFVWTMIGREEIRSASNSLAESDNHAK